MSVTLFTYWYGILLQLDFRLEIKQRRRIRRRTKFQKDLLSKNSNSNRIHRRRVKSKYFSTWFLLNRYWYDLLLRSLRLCITIYLTTVYTIRYFRMMIS